MYLLVPGDDSLSEDSVFARLNSNVLFGLAELSLGVAALLEEPFLLTLSSLGLLPSVSFADRLVLLLKHVSIVTTMSADVIYTEAGVPYLVGTESGCDFLRELLPFVDVENPLVLVLSEESLLGTA